jgi:peptidoglycan/xylan/chitin deacetylase (PgdA/CDA1 family)
VALASHTRSHRSLTALSVEEAEADMRASSEDFRHRLGIACRHIAYPYGHVNRQVREAAGRHFESGQTTRFACLTDGDDRLRLPRLDAFYFRRAGALDRWGDSAFRRRVKWVQARRWLSRYVR